MMTISFQDESLISLLVFPVMETWGRFMSWLGQGQNAAATQTVAAIVQVVFTLLALVIAICVPWWQQRNIKQGEKEKRDDELEKLRAALREEIFTLSDQCLVAVVNVCKYGISMPRGGSLPPLTVFEANASRIIWLNRREINSLIEFSGTLANLRYFLASPARTEDDKERTCGMLKDACQYAATFIETTTETIGLPEGRETKYQALLSDLRNAKFLQPITSGQDKEPA